MMDTIFVNIKDIPRKWYVVDAEGMILGRLAARLATILRGKDKPAFAPHQEMGDMVIVVNADKVAVTGKKRADKYYYRHSGYAGGFRQVSMGKIMQKRPTFPLEQAVKGMLPHNRLGRKIYKNLKVYAGPAHPHEAQQPEPLKIEAGE
jgi:large subunit ribosomal protein L13